MPCFSSDVEYTITMYDTKSRELRWNATYCDYASTLPDDDTKYSKTLSSSPLCRYPQVPMFSALCFPEQRWLILSPMATV